MHLEDTLVRLKANEKYLHHILVFRLLLNHTQHPYFYKHQKHAL